MYLCACSYITRFLIVFLILLPSPQIYMSPISVFWRFITYIKKYNCLKWLFYFFIILWIRLIIFLLGFTSFAWGHWKAEFQKFSHLFQRESAWQLLKPVYQILGPPESNWFYQTTSYFIHWQDLTLGFFFPCILDTKDEG